MPFAVCDLSPKTRIYLPGASGTRNDPKTPEQTPFAINLLFVASNTLTHSAGGGVKAGMLPKVPVTKPEIPEFICAAGDGSLPATLAAVDEASATQRKQPPWPNTAAVQSSSVSRHRILRDFVMCSSQTLTRFHRRQDILRVSNPQIIDGRQTTHSSPQVGRGRQVRVVIVRVIQVPRGQSDCQDEPGHLREIAAACSQYELHRRCSRITRYASICRFAAVSAGVANLELYEDAGVWGVLYLIATDEAEHLDRTEGVPSGGYRGIPVSVNVYSGKEIEAFTYQSDKICLGRKPSPRYIALLIESAAQRGLPLDYRLPAKFRVRPRRGCHNREDRKSVGVTKGV